MSAVRRVLGPAGLSWVLAGFLPFLAPATSRAQWVDFWFDPWGGGGYSVSQQVTVTIEFCAQDGAWFDYPGSAEFNGQPANFSGDFGSHPECDDYAVISGTITLEPGVNTLRAEISGSGYWWWTEEYEALDEPPESTPPTIAISPSRGSFSSSVPVTIDWCDETELDEGSAAIQLNGSSVLASFTVSSITKAGCAEARRATGSISLIEGANTLIASMSDGASNTIADTASFFGNSALFDLPPRPGDIKTVAACVANCFDAVATYTTPAYVSMDTDRSVTLLYRSSHAKSMGVIELDVLDTGTTPASMIELRLRRPNGSAVTFTSGDTAIFFSSGAGANRLAAQFDVSNEATAATQYLAEVRFHYNPVSTELAKVRVITINEKDSPFGWGWTVAGLQRLHLQSDSSVLITGGDGSAVLYTPTGCAPTCEYASPAGEFSTLTRRTGAVGADSIRYDRRFPDGTTVGFTDDGRMRRVQDRFSNAAVYAYDSNGRLSTITDPAGKVITFGYSISGGKLSSIQDAGSRTSTITIDGSNNLAEIGDPGGADALRLTYDGSHRLTEWIDRRGGEWDLTYDFAQKIDTLKLPSVTVNGSAARPILRFGSLERSVLVNPASGSGTSGSPATRRVPADLRAWTAGPRGDTTRYALDRWNAPSRIEQPRARVSVIHRNAAGQVDTTIARYGSSVADTTVQNWAGPNLTQVVGKTLSDTVKVLYETTYHQPTQLTTRLDTVVYWRNASAGARIDSIRTGRSGSYQKTKIKYDAKGRDTLVTDIGTHQTRKYYSSSGFQNLDSVKSPGTRVTSFTYDSYGRTLTRKDPENHIVRTEYDALNRLLRRINPANDTTLYTYDSLYLRKIRDAKGQEYEFVQNALGWVEVEKRPAVTSDTLRKQIRYAYDSAGNVIRTINRRGDTITFTYDAVNVALTRTANGATTTFASDSLDRWIATGNGVSTDTVKFNAVGQPTAEVTIRGSNSYAVTYGYDIYGQMTSVVTPWDTVGYRYTFFGGLDSLIDFSGAKTRVGYSAESLPVSIVLPTQPTGVTIGNGYLPSHRPDTIAYSSGHLEGHFGNKHAFNADGRLTMRIHSAGFAANDYGYDELGRLTSDRAWSGDASGYCWPNGEFGYFCDPVGKTTISLATFTYDEVGNRTDHGAGIETGNRLRVFDGDSLFYDDDGNLIKRRSNGSDTQRLYWDAVGQLMAVWRPADSVKYEYNGWGERTKREITLFPPFSAWGATTYLTAGGHVYAELDFDGSRVAEYAYYPGVDQPHSVRRSASTVYYYARDASGNVRGLITTGAQAAARYEYSAFGAPTVAYGGVSDNVLFASREYDNATGLYYNRSRYYDPKLGRFVSEDPLGIDGGINPYVYAGNDPVNFRDPSGMLRICGYMTSLSSDDPHKLPPVVITEPAPDYGCIDIPDDDEQQAGGGNGPSQGGGGGGGGGGGAGEGPPPQATPPAQPPRQDQRARAQACRAAQRAFRSAALLDALAIGSFAFGAGAWVQGARVIGAAQQARRATVAVTEFTQLADKGMRLQRAGRFAMGYSVALSAAVLRTLPGVNSVMAWRDMEAACAGM